MADKIDLRASGYSKDTPMKYLIHAAAIFINVDYDAEAKKFQAERCLGATSGGATFTIEQKYREVDIDGVITKAKGQDILDTSNAKIETTVKEITAELLSLSINGTIRDAEANEAPLGYKVVEGKGQVDSSDYIRNVGVYGRITGSNQPILIIMNNAISTGGLKLQTKDKSEAGVPLTLEARADEDQVEELKAPCKIFFPPLDKLNPVQA